MIASFRHYLNTWVARGFFLLLVAVFIVWGVGDVIRNVGSENTAVATVAGQRIELSAATDAYRRALSQVSRSLGTDAEPSPEIRRGVAAQALEGLITRTAVAAAVADFGIAVPDAALRAAVLAMPAFAGPDGKFDRGQFENVLRNNNYSEAGFLELLRGELGEQELMDAVRAGEASPETLTKLVFAFQQEKRVADAVDLPFADARAPAAPTAIQLDRWYDNHKDLYSTPEYRRIKLIVLSPETVAKDVPITDDDLKAAYDARRSEFDQPERRSLEVLLTTNEATAQALAARWRSGADWTAMQAAATEAGATPTEVTDATEAGIPAPELAQAAFATPEGTVADPVKSPLGWHVFKVVKVTPPSVRPLAEVRDVLRAQVLADKAADVIYDRANKIDDLLAGGTSLDDLPADLGVAALTGTLDHNGMTPQGQPAPIPGDPALRAALIASAFETKKGDVPHLTEAPHEPNAPQSFYAVAVDDIIPPAAKPFAEVESAVRADWTRDAVHHEQEEAAAQLLAAVKGGQTLDEAARAAHVTIHRLPPVGRAVAPPPGVPLQLVDPLFTLKRGEPTMIETDQGFTVAVLAEVQEADPNADPIGYGQVREALGRTLGDDMQAAVTTALRDRGHPEVNRAMLDTIAQPE
jgi:peptidyl-prolyl cis-trans isomerase D